MTEFFPYAVQERNLPAYGGIVLASLAEAPDMRLATSLGKDPTNVPTNQSTREMTGPDNYGKYDSTADTEPDSRED